jgi:cystathionine beta-lyase
MERKNGMAGGNKGGTLGDETRATHAGNHPHRNHGVINPPVYRASTILYPDVATLEQVNKDRLSRIAYGRYGTPTVTALEEAVTALEAADGPSFSPPACRDRRHLAAASERRRSPAMVDTVYGPARGFCDKVLSKFGVEVTYYDPSSAAPSPS